MSLLHKFLEFVVNGDANFCCLCFNENNNNSALHTDIFIELAERKQYIALSDMLKCVLGNEVHEFILSFDNICEECIKSLSTMYTFIQNTKYYAKCLTTVLDWLNKNFKQMEGDNKSVFMLINLQDGIFNHILDNEKLRTKSAALKRLNFLKLRKANEDIKVEEKSNKSMKGYIKTEIATGTNNSDYYKCKVCSKMYRTVWNLKNHCLRVHAPQTYKCTKCSRSFGSQGILNIHLKDSHCHVICSECGKSFNSRSALIKHEQRHTKKFVCHNCGRTYKTIFSYKHHVSSKCKEHCRASPANATFTCDYCNKKYTQKISLRVHIQYEHGNYKSHICEWCGKKFWAQSRLKAHVVKHTGEKNYPCSICKRNFVTKESLLYHTRLHTGEKPYRCSECGSGFISASRKMYHMKTYHQAANAECDICHSKFSSAAYLHKHKACHQTEIEGNLVRKTVNIEQKNKYKCIKSSATDTENLTIHTEVSKLLNDNPDIYNDQIGTIEALLPKTGDF